MMAVMFWLLSEKVGDMQDDTERNLVTRVEMPNSIDATDAYFTLTNGGHYDIDHVDYCGVHLIVGAHGSYSAFSATTDQGPLFLGSGDSRSVQCLSPMRLSLRGDVICADVEFWTEYSLEKEPSKINRKYFRYFGYLSGGAFTFVPEPPAGPKWDPKEDYRYCGRFLSYELEQQSRK